MRHLLILLFVISIFACAQKPKALRVDSSVDSLKTIQTGVVDSDKSNLTIAGLYEFVYENNTPSLIENHYIKIQKVSNNYVGYYWGTSDEFDEAREGYYPGFFVAKMDTLVIKNDMISFTLDVDAGDMFEKVIPQNIKTSDKARSTGFSKWKQSISYKPRHYNGKIIGKSIEFPDQNGGIRIFKKKKITPPNADR